MSSTPSLTGLVESTQLLVVGAGPVGLFAGLCAARRGLRVALVERNFRGCEHGHASILHPSSLRLLDEHGLSSQLRAAGSVVERIDLRVDGRLVKSLELAMPALTISQGAFEELLLKELRAKAIEIKAPYVATAFEQEPAGVRTHIQRREPLGSPAHCDEWECVEASSIDSAFVIGADGYSSGVREALGLDNLDVGATETFAMFEGPEASATESSTLELAFAAGLGSIVMPLPKQRTRWGFQLVSALDAAPNLDQLRALVGGRMPWRRSPPERVDWSTVTHFERRLARSFGNGRVWLAGDAAHITSPFGGQSMNGGLTEVHDLVDRMADCLLEGKSLDTVEQLGAAREREWAELLGFKVELQNPDNALAWLRGHARRIISALPASGLDLQRLMRDLGVTIH
jgi:2-polyprenyl-6-methoxyphenol hydroxylase-like FAD-dependent oxidoreductase